MTAELPPDVVVAAGRAIELLSRVLKEGGRSDEEQLEFATAIIDIAIAIDPEERKKLEPFVPTAAAVLREIDPEAWTAHVEGLTHAERVALIDLLAKYGEAPEQPDT